jgi:hypothetical protein
MMTLEKELTHQEQLNKELREFLEYHIHSMIYRPNADKTIAAVEPYFPELVEKFDYIDEILDECGIVAITDIGSKKQGTHERISYSVADNDADAQHQLEKYSQPAYKEIRKALDIGYHWVLRIEESFRFYNSNTLVEAHMVFECDFGKPNVCVIELE